MAFDKVAFYKKAEKWIKDNGWTDESEQLDKIRFHYHLEQYPYIPRYVIEKDKTFFFLSFFQKGAWGVNKRVGQVTGLDYYKYKFMSALQAQTGIQVGLVMYSEEENKFIFRQLDQLPKPIIYFKGFGCRMHELKKFDYEYHCFRCWKKFPLIADECIHQRKRLHKRKKREMAMWSINEFSDQLIIQNKML